MKNLEVMSSPPVMTKNYNSLPSQRMIMNGNYVNGKEVNGNYSNGYHTMNNKSLSAEKFEIPLPFGYHMDLDFLRFCSEDLVSDETLERLKDLRKQRRKERKTLEALMGIKQEQRDRERRLRDLSHYSKKISPTRSLPEVMTSRNPPDVVNTSEFVREALREAVCDFEKCLARSKLEDGDESSSSLQSFDLMSGILKSSTPMGSKGPKVASKFNTFPRAMVLPHSDSETASATYKMYKMSSNSSLSSISTSSSAMPYSSEAVLAGLPSSIANRSDGDQLETDSIGSITSDMSTTTLRNIREQMARSLVKLKEYEKQVEAIPVIQAKLSVLKEEKRLLMLQLKQKELQMRRDRGEEDEEDIECELESDDEDGEGRPKFVLNRKRKFDLISNRRARSESPYSKSLMSTVNPNEFISVQRKRSTSCGYNSEEDVSDHVSPLIESRYYEDGRSHTLNNLHERSEISFYTTGGKHVGSVAKKAQTKETGVNTDAPPKAPTPPPPVRTRDRASNTDPPPRSPPPPRKVTHGTNTTTVRTIPRGTLTNLSMKDMVTKDEMEKKIQEAVFKTEEEIMGCPLLQKAMAKVEEEAMGVIAEEDIETVDAGCQVGDENLRPFVISVGLQCKIEDPKPLQYECACQATASVRDSDSQSSCSDLFRSSIDLGRQFEFRPPLRTIGVGECKVIEDPPDPMKFREIGVCTEKWVEVIKASKQTDTEDFAFKDTESPRVVDLFGPYEPPSTPTSSRKGSLRKSVSPSASRRSSMASSPAPSRKASSSQQTSRPTSKSQSTMTTETRTRDAKTGGEVVQKRDAATTAMMLPLVSGGLPAPGSPLTTPELERPPVNLNLCDKCNKDIKQVAEGVFTRDHVTSPRIAPPSPDFPWVSKIPRPVPENPDVHKLKSATSTGDLSEQRSRSPLLMQRSKSNLTPSQARRLVASPRADMGTPPPHPGTPPTGRNRVASPLARSHSPYSTSSSSDKRSLIPRLSPGLQRKQLTSSPKSSEKSSPSSETKSFIPRVQTPPALRKMFPKESDKLATPDRNVVRKNTYTKATAGVSNPDLEKQSASSSTSSAASKPFSSTSLSTSSSDNSEKKGSLTDKLKKTISDIKEKLSGSDTEDETDEKRTTKRLTAGGFPLPGAALFTPIDENRTKAEPSKEMKAALKVLNDSLSRGARNNAQVTNAINIIQQEWFKVSSTKQSNPLDVEDYLDAIEDMSKELLSRVVNLMDVNGNTALHYSVSHGSFDVVSVLLDSKVGNPNILNKAGYTCIMLISLAQIQNDTHRAIVGRLFELGDVNIRASQHGQTALMLAVSHGRADVAQLLVESGADVNIRDEDGSTALMCAAEHGHMEIVKFLLALPDCNVHAKDNDGLTALAVAMEAGHRDIGVVLYASMSFSRGASPYSSMKMKRPSSRTSTPTGSIKSSGKTPPPRSPVPPTPPHRSRRNSSNQ